MRLLRRLLLLAIVLVAVLALPVAAGHVQSASFVVRAADMHGWWADPLARWRTVPVTTRETDIPGRHGTLRARIYEPAERRSHVVLLTGGVHADGIDEPRLVKLAHDLSAGGTPVVTAEVPDLLRYRITPALTDAIEEAALWVAGDPSLAPDGRVALFGVSFAGGLSIAAAGRPRLRDHIVYVVSFGGHGDLPRVVRYLCTGEQPDGEFRKPHDYGVVITLLNTADQLVPPDQVQPLRDAIVAFLTASHTDMVDKPAAQKQFAHARELQRALPEPAATLMGYVNDRKVKELGAVLLPHFQSFAEHPSLSPELAPGISAPVFLIHGADDNVVPAIEAELLAEKLRPHVPVHVLITPLITHAEVDGATGLWDVWDLIRFWYAVGRAGAM